MSRWYNSAYYDEPDAPHSTIQAANGVEWYAMQQHAEAPAFEAGDAADGYNRAQFQSFMPGYEQPVTSLWMDPVVWTGILRSGMKTDQRHRCSTIRLQYAHSPR